jgi:predicted ATPase
MIGKNGSGKTSILDCLQIIGNFARGGANRAFGPPPWSLSWQRTKGMGTFLSMRFDCWVTIPDGGKYRYYLSISESKGQARVEEERLVRLPDQSHVASFDFNHSPASSTILNPPDDHPKADEVRRVGDVFRSVVSYELNPSKIEQGNDPTSTGIIGRDGFGVAAFLANMKDNHPERFAKLEQRLKRFRPETQDFDIFAGGNSIFWGLRSQHQQRAFPAVHLSWGDRQLVGLLCILYQHSQTPGNTIGIEEIDRGFHPSRYNDVIELLSEAAYDGIDGGFPLQIVITTHSPSFLSKLTDRTAEVRMVTRESGGATVVRPLEQLVRDSLGSSEPQQPLGELWELGIFETAIESAMN